MKREVTVKAEYLTKKFGDLIAVNSIDFKIFKGESFGFLGPNGAGKTSTMKMIHWVSPPTSGNLKVANMNFSKNEREIKNMIGVVPQEDNLDPDFTVFKNLTVYARYFDISK